jgi:endonuclease/exonuclease/phosphatase family metal-dependent hydrolase
MAFSFFRRFTKGFFITSNIIVAILFLLGCYAAWFNPNRFWFLGLLSLVALYLLLLLIIFIVFWLFAKKKLTLISIIAIILAWAPIRQLIKFKLSSDFNIQKNATALRVMSWNIEHFDILEHKKYPERKTEMLDLINQYQPDVACFQEMVGAEKDSTAINYLPSIKKYLNFPYYYYSFEPENNFDGKHHFGILTFSRYPIVSKKTINRNNSKNYNENFQYVDIKKGDDTVRVFNIHLQSLKFSKENLKYLYDATEENKVNIGGSKSIISKLKAGFINRKVQSENIQKEISKSPYPVVVCGDFNDVPNSYAYNTVGKNLQNAFAEEGAGIGRTFSNISPTLRIDNIFVGKQFEIEQYVCIQKKLSDHFPIISDIILEK